jgi:hypothetical protein
MSRVIKLMLNVAVLVSLPAGAALAQGYRDAGAKAAGNFGTGFYSGGMRSAVRYRSMPVYSAPPAPQMVQSMAMPTPAPAAPQVAQAPTERRSFSTEPSQTQAAPMVPAAPQVIRSYSYVPSAPAYVSPMQSGRTSMPTYLLPRSDPRKHGG